MHLKFLARGTGSAALAAAYLLAVKDASGKARAAVEVLRGDPHAVAALADGLPFKHRYTSGVVAWSPEDAPTRPELERFVDEFEKTAWAGLDPDRYAWAVVLHRDDDGGVHLHIFVARCDLATGVSLNIAPPGWERTFDPLRDAFNLEHGWSRPDDASRARPFRPAPHLAYQARAARRAGEDVEPDPRREIGMHLLELVATGRVTDRAGVVAALEARGYDVPRQGEHYVTARDPATGERWRLKGGLYERDFDRARFLREVPEPSVYRDRADDVDDPAAAAWKAVEKARRRRADYNRAYYGPGRLPGRDGVQAVGAVGEVARERGLAAGRSAGGDASLASHLEQELGDGAVAAVTEAAESAREAGEGGEERSLAAATALAEAAGAAGPDLSRALNEHVAVRERAVWATSTGGEWLAEAQQEVLGEEDRPLTVGERVRAVEPVEGRLETEFSRRESEVAAVSFGPLLLQETFGERRAEDARLSLSARERGLAGVERRVREALRAREEALQRIPFGRQCLGASSQSGDAAGAAETLPDWESRVRGAEQQVVEELDRLEEELLAAGGEDMLAEAVGAVAGDGRTRALGERWVACERARSGFEEALDREEAAVRAGPGGEELLRDVGLEVLGAAGRETATTLGDRACIVKAAAAAKRDADERWNEEKAARVEALGRLPGGLDLYHAQLADRDLAENSPASREHDKAALAAAESDDTRLERLRDVLSNKADAACYREVLDQVGGQFKTSDLDRALAAGEEEGRRWGKKRNARLDALERQPGGQDLYYAHLANLDPAWGVNGNTTREHIDAALAAAESDDTRLERLRDVLSNKADAACYREVLDQVGGQFKTSDLDRALAAGEKARAERETRQWEEKRNALVEELRAVPGGMDLYHAHLADRDPKWDRKRHDKSSRANIDAALGAAESDAPRLERLQVVLSDEVAAIRYREDLGRVAGQYTTSDLDRALAAGEREREEREAARRAVALETATEAAQVAAARSNVKLLDAHVREIYETGKTHAAGLAAVERTTRALDDAANQRLPAAMVIHTWNAYRSEPGGIAAGLDAATTFARHREAERAAAAAARVSRLEQLLDKPASAEAFIAALDDEASSWRTGTGTHPACIDRALDVAERGLGRRKADTWRHQQHELVLKAEQQFPGIPSAAWRDAGRSFRGQTAIDRHGESVSRMLSDRACARARAAEEPSAEPEPARNLVQQVTDWLRAEVERQQLEALRARTGAARLAQRHRNSLRPVIEPSPPAPKPARLVPAAAWEDAEPLWRALTNLHERTDRGRLAQRARNSAIAVPETSPPVPKPARLVPAATREDAAALVRARLPEAEQQELRLGVDVAARELAKDFGRYEWWSHAGGELEDAHLREDRYLTKDPVEIGMLRTVLEKNVYEEAFRLVEHPVVEPDPPTNIFELVRAFIRRLQDAVDRLIDRVLDHKPEPAEPGVAKVSAAEEPARLTFAERYSRDCPEHADDIRHPDFEELAAGAEARNKLFERQELYSSKWSRIEMKELPIALAKSAPRVKTLLARAKAPWTDEAVEKVTWAATPGVGPERASHQQTVDAHLGHYEHHLPEVYSAEWRAIRERAERAIMDLQETPKYKRAKKDRKKRELESTAINRACGRDARCLHEKMMAEREAARPAWEVTVRIRAVLQIERKEADLRAREQDYKMPVHRSRDRAPRPTRDRGPGR